MTEVLIVMTIRGGSLRQTVVVLYWQPYLYQQAFATVLPSLSFRSSTKHSVALSGVALPCQSLAFCQTLGSRNNGQNIMRVNYN